MPGPYKTEGIVLRSIRFAEADRVLTLYTERRGSVGAVAKGVRRVRSRFAGRLEQFARVELLLHEGRGELHTVTGAATVAAHAHLRERSGSLEAAATSCEAVMRVLGAAEPNRPAYNLLARRLELLDSEPAAADPAAGVAFRLKLLLAAGFLPELGQCAACGAREGLCAFSAAAGGAVCGDCDAAGAFALSQQALAAMRDALEAPLAQLREVPPPALRQADRAVTETLAYHAHVQLRALA